MCPLDTVTEYCTVYQPWCHNVEQEVWADSFHKYSILLRNSLSLPVTYQPSGHMNTVRTSTFKSGRNKASLYVHNVHLQTSMKAHQSGHTEGNLIFLHLLTAGIKAKR